VIRDSSIVLVWLLSNKSTRFFELFKKLAVFFYNVDK
jgi:hypothetical protein